MTGLVHRCDLRTMVAPALQAAVNSAPAGDYSIRIAEHARCPDCSQRWYIEGHSNLNGDASLSGEHRSWWRWWL